MAAAGHVNRARHARPDLGGPLRETPAVGRWDRSAMTGGGLCELVRAPEHEIPMPHHLGAVTRRSHRAPSHWALGQGLPPLVTT